NQMALRASDEARSIDASLKARGQEDARRFAHLEVQAAKRESQPPAPQKSGSSWTDKIAKMRETYPNAYRPWQTADDAVLKQEFQSGASVAELSDKLGRHEGSIKMRLQKHFGEDVTF